MVQPRTAIVSRALFAVAGATIATTSALAAAWGWKDTAALVVVSAVALHGGISAVDNTRTSFIRTRRERRQNRRDDFRKASISAAFEIGDLIGADARRIGVGLFKIVPAGWPRLEGMRLRRGRRLRRIERFRFLDHPQVARVIWTEGKGAVGKAWATGTPTYRDWRPIARSFANKEITDFKWEKMKAETRAGFTRSEFKEMLCKYDEVLAIPVKSRRTGEVLGCLAVDIAKTDDGHADGVQRLNRSVVQDLAERTAILVGNYLQ